MKKHTFHIRDKREPGYYQIDTIFIKGGWAKALGPYGLAVYNVLACFADNDTQAAFPMYQTIAALAGCSRRKVIQVMTELETYHLIKKQKRGHDQGQTSNYYTLLHRDEWLPPAPLEASSGASPAPPSASPAPTPGESPAPELSPDSLSNPSLKEGAAIARPAPVSQRSRTRTVKHPAIETYRRVTGRYPPKATEPLITKTGIETEPDLTFWEEVIRHYIGCGWSPQNLGGMLDYYQRRELPSTRPKKNSPAGGSNGTHQQHSPKATHHVATLADFDLTPRPDQNR